MAMIFSAECGELVAHLDCLSAKPVACQNAHGVILFCLLGTRTTILTFAASKSSVSLFR